LNIHFIPIGANRVGLRGAKPSPDPIKPPPPIFTIILKFNVPINNQMLFSTAPYDCKSLEYGQYKFFSAMRRLKTWMRSTMLQERFSSLWIINIEKDINIDRVSVLNDCQIQQKNNINIVTNYLINNKYMFINIII